MAEPGAREVCRRCGLPGLHPGDDGCVLVLQAALRTETAARQRAEGDLQDWRTYKMADATGHMLVCAKVNGKWACAKGCAVARADAAEAALRDAHAEGKSARLLVAVLLDLAGGEVFVPDSTLLRLNNADVIERTDRYDKAGRTYRLIRAALTPSDAER